MVLFRSAQAAKLRCSKQNIRALYSRARRYGTLVCFVVTVPLFSAIFGWLAPNLHFNQIRFTCSTQQTSPRDKGSKISMKTQFCLIFKMCLRYKPCRHTRPPNDPLRIRETFGIVRLLSGNDLWQFSDGRS